jgi:hypothetical protein
VIDVQSADGAGVGDASVNYRSVQKVDSRYDVIINNASGDSSDGPGVIDNSDGLIAHDQNAVPAGSIIPATLYGSGVIQDIDSISGRS